MTVVAFSAVRIFHPTRSITNGTGRHLFKFFTCVKNFIVRFCPKMLPPNTENHRQNFHT